MAVPETNFFNLAFEGKVEEDGDEIEDGQAVNSDGNSFVMECKLDPKCEVVSTERGGGSWSQQ